MALTLVVKGERFALPEDLKFSFEEIAVVERITGQRLNSSFDESPLMLPALAVVAMRRAGRNVNERDVMAMRLGDELQVEEEERSEQDPPLRALGNA